MAAATTKVKRAGSPGHAPNVRPLAHPGQGMGITGTTGTTSITIPTRRLAHPGPGTSSQRLALASGAGRARSRLARAAGVSHLVLVVVAQEGRALWDAAI